MLQNTKHTSFSPAQLLVVGFIAMILIGTLLLWLPAATQSGKPLPLLDALFTATSGVSVTGLSVFDPGTRLSLFGQLVLLALIQLGGLGFMTITSLLYQAMHRRISLKDRVVMVDSMVTSGAGIHGIVHMTKYSAIIAGVSEGVGTLLFATRFVPLYGLGRGLYYSVFHAVSSFCNAGFDVFGLDSSLIPFRGDAVVVLTTAWLVLMGGIGFFVIVELGRRPLHKRPQPLSLHARIVLLVTGLLLLTGFVVFALAEWNNPATLGADGMNTADKLLSAFSQSANAGTAGFTVMPQVDMAPTSKAVTIALMFIGSSPSGTGGGIRTTTFALVILFIVTILKGKEDVEIFGRTVNRQQVLRALATFMLSIFVLIVFAVIMIITQHEHLLIDEIVFEITAAFSTTGFSSGITAILSPFNRILLIIAMLIGRVGVLTFTFALARRLAEKNVNIKYPEEKILL